MPREEGRLLGDAFISEVVQPADWVATPVHNYISFKDILKDGHLPGEGNLNSPRALGPLLQAISGVIFLNYLIKKYEQACAKEKASDTYQFIRLFNKRYEKDDPPPCCLHLLGVAYYYNDEVSWIIRKFRFLKGFFNKKYGFSEVRKKLEDSSISKLRLQLLHQVVDCRNTQEKIDNLCTLYHNALEREAKSYFDKQESKDLSTASITKLYEYRKGLEDEAKSFFSKQSFEDLSDKGINILSEVYRNSLHRVVVKPPADQSVLKDLSNELRTLYGNSLQNKLDLFKKCKSEGLDIGYINILRSSDRNFLDGVVNLLKEKGLEETDLDSLSQSIDALCEEYCNASKKLVEVEDQEKYKEILPCVDALYKQYGDFLKRIVTSFSAQQKPECLSSEHRKQLLAQHCNALQGMVNFNNYLLKPDTWIVADKKKVTMSDEAFKEKLGKVFDQARAESRKSKDERLNSRIEATKNQLEEYKNQFILQIDQLKKRLKENESSLKEQDSIWLEELKNNPDTDIRKIKFNFLKGKKDAKTIYEYNFLLYIQEIYKGKKRQQAELEKQANQGWVSKAGDFINDHIIKDLANASFIFWIGFFVALFMPVHLFPIALAVAIGLGALYVVLSWGSKIYGYCKNKKTSENLDHEIKEELIREQWLSMEPQYLTLDQEIVKLNHLSQLKSDRVKLLERKSTWIFADAILEGFVRGCFAPFFILWISTTAAGLIASSFFGIAAINPLVLAILTTVTLVLAIGYGIYKAVSYYKATQREIDHLRETFHNEKLNQYCLVVDKCCDYLKDKCIQGLVNDGLDATVKEKFEKEIEAQRIELKKKYLSVLGSEQSNQIVQELEQALSEFFKQENTEELKKSFRDECKTLTQKFNKPVQSAQLNKRKSRFKEVAQACLNFINAGGSGILFFKLLVMGVILAWLPVFIPAAWLATHALVAPWAIGVFVIAAILYGGYSVWKYYRSVKEESIINASTLEMDDLSKEAPLSAESESSAPIFSAEKQCSDGKTFDCLSTSQEIFSNEKFEIKTSLSATDDESKEAILPPENGIKPVVLEKSQSASDVMLRAHGEKEYSPSLFPRKPRESFDALSKGEVIRCVS